MAKRKEIAMEEADLIKLLEDKRLGDSIAQRLIELYNKPLPLAGKKYSEAIQVKILESYFDVKDIRWFLKYFRHQTPKVQFSFLHCMLNHIEELCEVTEDEGRIPIPVYAHTLCAMQPEQAKKLRRYLPDSNFELVCSSNKKPTFSGTEDVKIILEYFKSQNWISSYQLRPSGQYQAFSKQRKGIPHIVRGKTAGPPH